MTLLTTITVATFLPVVEYGFVDYDDPAYITENPYVSSGLDAQNIRWAFSYHESKGPPKHAGIYNLYHPVTWISHMVDLEMFGPDSPGHQHLMNLIHHLLAGIILYFIFSKLLQGHVCAFVTAALFCVHPLHVESVAWLSQRKDTLSALFAFASILSYLHYSDTRRRLHQACSIAFLVLALLTKPSVVILPGLLILMDQYRQHRMLKLDRAFLMEQLRHKLPWIIPCLAAALAAILLQQQGSHGYFIQGTGLWDRLYQLPIRLAYYFYKTLNPTGLSFHYAAPAYPTILLSGICLTLLLVLSAFAFRVRRQFPLLLFGLAWFCICILPVSGILYVGSSFISDRYTYLAIIGLFPSLPAALNKHLSRQLSHGALGLTVLACALLSRQQTRAWENSYTLFTNAIEKQPRDPTGYVNLGAAHVLNGRHDEAEPLYRKALELAPHDYIAHHNLAQIHLKQQRWSEAEQSLLKALEIYGGYAPSMKSLSMLHATIPEVRDFEKSLRFAKLYNQAVRERDPAMLEMEIKLLLKLGRKQEAATRAMKLRQLGRPTNQTSN